jgi:hypothetical protein
MTWRSLVKVLGSAPNSPPPSIAACSDLSQPGHDSLDPIWTRCACPDWALETGPQPGINRLAFTGPLQNNRNALEVLAGAISWRFKSPLRTIFNNLQALLKSGRASSVVTNAASMTNL